jgi:hypothetical protein
MPVEFSVEADGTMTAAGAIYGANGSLMPLAFASVSFDGSKQSGTSNLRTTYNRTTRTYEISLDGIHFNRTQYTAIASVSGWNGRPLFINTDDSADGKLLVDLRDINGSLGQADFQVVVFKAQ